MQQLLKDSSTISEEQIEQIDRILEAKGGFDISGYRRGALLRRLRARLAVLGIAEPSEYIKILKNDNEEIYRLINILTIHVSNFFRNPELFWELEKSVLPHIFSYYEGKNEKVINFLSIGCSTGEEPYSVSLLLLERFKKYTDLFDIRITGIDVDPEVIHLAQKGIYEPKQLKSLPEDWREKYFKVTVDGNFQIIPDARRLVRFLRLNALRDPLPVNISLALCRNLMIFLKRDKQAILINRIKGILKENGFLVLGKAEGITPLLDATGLELVNSSQRIYTFRGGVDGTV